ncbi:MAG TPA: helix-turn-helix transcriptional regulator [Chroococcales cyanobacterium]
MLSEEFQNIDPEDLLARFSEVVRRRRESLAISQEELGARAGLHRTYISDVECGARNLSLKTLCRLSVALRTSPSQLIALAEGKLAGQVNQVD